MKSEMADGERSAELYMQKSTVTDPVGGAFHLELSAKLRLGWNKVFARAGL